MNSLAQCFYTLGHVTRARRASETPCFGTLETYNGREARERGFYDDVCLCLDHSRIRYDEFRRCAFRFDADRCSGSLRACPSRLCAPLDEITGEPAAYVCWYHFKEMDSCEQLIEHPRYEPPAKRVAAVQVCTT